MDDVAWRGLAAPFARGRIWTGLHAKRWHYAGVISESAFAAVAVVDLGWVASAFAYCFDRRARRLRADCSWLGAPVVAATVATRPGSGARSVFAVGGDWHVVGRGPGFAMDAHLDAGAAPPSLCAIAPIQDGVASCTHKTTNLPARGWVEAGGERLSLDGGWGSLDQTSGLLARDTHWRWAAAAGPRIGLNLSAGFMGDSENAVWVDGRLHRLAGAKFELDVSDPERPWHIRTAEGALELTFTPDGLRRQDKDLVVAASRYVMPFGTFRGRLRLGGVEVPVTDLPGVTEHHVARW